jgi:sugar transferase (PEP-CTERM/EpsH1 system associated)
MKILYVTPYVPSQIRTRPYNLIRALLELGHQVTLLTAAGTSAGDQEQADALREWGMGVDVVPVPLARSLRNCFQSLPTREPLQAADAYHPQMERRLVDLLQENDFDVVHIEHLRAARLVRAVDGVPVVYDSVDCISALFEQAAQDSPQIRSRLMAVLDLRRTRPYEAWLLTQYDQVVVTSCRDREALERLADYHLASDAQPAPITVVTNGVDLEYFRPLNSVPKAKDPTVVFTGKMSYHANVAAVLYFAKHVLPLVRAEVPRVRFQIVGKGPPQSVRRLETDRHIEVTGYVDDLRPYLAGATVAVCPALYAVGVQNKVLEAMAMGAPVVTTPSGCAALDVEDGREVLIAEGEGELAEAVLKVLSDTVSARRLAEAGRRYVEDHHSWEAGARRLVDVYSAAGVNSVQLE